MINLVLSKDCNNKKKIIYTFYYLTKKLNIEIQVSYKLNEKCINIFYGIEPKGNKFIFIPKEDIDFKREVFLNKYNNYTFLTFNKALDKPYTLHNNKIIFNYDIFMTSFIFISCLEEYNSSKQDYLNRFLASYSFKKDYIDIPFFDVNASILYESLKILDNSIKISDNNFRIMLTHDVDNINSQTKNVFLHNAKELLLNFNKPFKNRVSQLIRQSFTNRYCQFENCINLELKYNAKSEFYFLQGKKGRIGKRYELEELEKYKILFERYPQFIVGLHTNVYSYNNKDYIKEEIDLIEKFFDIKVESCRNHYLRFKVPETWKLLQQCGIEFDTTLGFSDINGFRAGTSQSFLPYDAINDYILNIYEIPLIIMDVVLLENSAKYEDKLMKAIKLINLVKENKGTGSLLWHQCLLEDREYRNMYEDIIKYIVSNNGIFVTKEDLRIYKEIDINNLNKLIYMIENF